MKDARVEVMLYSSDEYSFNAAREAILSLGGDLIQEGDNFFIKAIDRPLDYIVKQAEDKKYIAMAFW